MSPTEVACFEVHMADYSQDQLAAGRLEAPDGRMWVEWLLEATENLGELLDQDPDLDSDLEGTFRAIDTTRRGFELAVRDEGQFSSEAQATMTLMSEGIAAAADACDEANYTFDRVNPAE